MENELIFTPISEFKTHFPTFGDADGIKFTFVTTNDDIQYIVGAISKVRYDETKPPFIYDGLFTITHYCIVNEGAFILQTNEQREYKSFFSFAHQRARERLLDVEADKSWVGDNFATISDYASTDKTVYPIKDGWINIDDISRLNNIIRKTSSEEQNSRTSFAFTINDQIRLNDQTIYDDLEDAIGRNVVTITQKEVTDEN